MSTIKKISVAELLAHIQSPERGDVRKIYHDDVCLCLAKPFGQTERRIGPQEYVALNEAYHRAFPSFRIEVDNLLEEGDRAVVQWRLVATPARDFVEPITQLHLHPSADTVQVEGIAFHRFRDGRVFESFLLQDDLGLLLQLGVDPGGLPVVDVQPPGPAQPTPYDNGAESPQKKFIREFMAAVVNEPDEARREESAARFIHTDMRLYGPDAGNVDPQYTGLAKFTAGHRKYRRAFPHFKFVTQDMVEDGSRVALRWAVADAWHTGPLQFGDFELHPTGNNANVHGAAICEMKDGKIASIWQLTDSASLLRQLMS